jgi:hypothetical protein
MQGKGDKAQTCQGMLPSTNKDGRETPAFW